MAIPDKSGFPHFLLKEIHEQPAAVRETVLAHLDTTTGRIALGGPGLDPEELQRLSKINIAASGTSRHAGMAGRTMIHELAHVPVEVDYASEFENRNVPSLGELTISITQSGETADTLAALRRAKLQGSRTLAITNVANSTIAKEADSVILTHAGPEISIASTKAFTAQMTALFLFALRLGEVRGAVTSEAGRSCLAELLKVPEKIEIALALDEECRVLAHQYHRMDDFLFVGRGIHYPIAMDGALKLKEISYIHAEGYPSGEMKHGPYALLDEHLPIVALATRDPGDEGSTSRWKRTLANLSEVKRRGARVIAVAVEGDSEVAKAADHVVAVPAAPELLLPMLEIIPLQLLAYHIAVALGRDVDNPRNLVKAVTTD